LTTIWIPPIVEFGWRLENLGDYFSNYEKPLVQQQS